MEFYLLPIFAFLSLALALSHASLPSEVYWQKVLPNTPMPKAIRDLLNPAADKSAWMNTNEDGDGGGGGGNVGLFHYHFHYNEKSPTAKNLAGENPAATASVHDGSIKNNVGNFFLEKDLHRGATMKLHFTKTHKGATFLPRQVADSMPFSSNKFPQILNQFSVKPKSVEAKVMKHTIVECEGPGNEGEDKYCATSLESLIDIATSELGNEKNKNPIPLTTEVDSTKTREEYKIGGVVKMAGDKAVACHKMNYPYAVFFCHATHGTRTYVVNPLVVANNGDQKMKSEAVAICHLNTSSWDPDHLAFQVLKVKPGTVPICHFLPNGDHIAWVPNN